MIKFTPQEVILGELVDVDLSGLSQETQEYLELDGGGILTDAIAIELSKATNLSTEFFLNLAHDYDCALMGEKPPKI